MNNSPIYDRIIKALSKRSEQDAFRTIHPVSVDKTIDLSTNSYLSLHTNQEVLREARELTADILSGSLASRLVMENSVLYARLESELASWEQSETALVFPSGYAANVGIIQAVCTKDTEVFCDRLNHASIYDGIKLSGCKINRYRHLDMTDLRNRLAASCSKEKIIITDTVFSMDGDRAPLADICALSNEFNCMVMVDEAHATGIFGSQGSGLVEETGTADRIDIRMGTLSKALASIGGYFTGSAIIRDYLVNFSRSLIYSTGLPHATLAFTIAAIHYIRKHPHLGRDLLARAENFRTRIRTAGYSVLNSTTQIIPCIVSSKCEAIELSRYLKDMGISAPAIRPPTVPENTSRIRLSYTLNITDEEEEYVVDQLTKWKMNHA